MIEYSENPASKHFKKHYAILALVLRFPVSLLFVKSYFILTNLLTTLVPRL